MSTDDLKNVFLDRGCLPHQADFAARFLSINSPRTHVLRSSPGLGKGFTAATICSVAWASAQAKHILVLSPAALATQWVGMIRRGSPEIPVMVIGRKLFRELEANVRDDESPWPENGVVVMSFDLAKQGDIAKSLSLAKWDLLVFDEAHHLTPQSQRHKLALSLRDGFPDARVLLLRAAGPDFGDDIGTESDPLLRGATITVWTRNTVRDRDGRPLLPEVHVQWITYRRRPDEVAVLSQLEESLRLLKEPDTVTRMIASLLMRSASSSPFTLEQRLNRIWQQRNDVSHARIRAAQEDCDGEDGDLSEEGETESADRLIVSSALGEIAGRLLAALDGVESDSKLDALWGLLDSTGALTNPECRVCIITRFVDTVTYLRSVLVERGLQVTTVTGALSFKEREQIVQQFAQNGRILIATESASAVMPEVTAVVLYDVPRNSAVLDALIWQFVRIGRTQAVRVFAFTDEVHALVIEQLQRRMAEFKQNLDESELQRVLFPEEPGNPGISQESAER